MGAGQYVALKRLCAVVEKSSRELNQFIRVCKRRHRDVFATSLTTLREKRAAYCRVPFPAIVRPFMLMEKDVWPPSRMLMRPQDFQGARPPLWPTGFSVYASPALFTLLTVSLPFWRSAAGTTLDTCGWLALTRRGLIPRKLRQASLGTITTKLRGAAFFTAPSPASCQVSLPSGPFPCS